MIRQTIDPCRQPRAWIEGWYRIVCRATGCTATLKDFPAADGTAARVALSDGEVEFGLYDPDRNLIHVRSTPNPYEDLATILHEVAHWHQNQRHHRAHGYSWRREFSEITRIVLSDDPLPLARRIRPGLGRRSSRMAALDFAVTHLVISDRPVLSRVGDRWYGVIGGRALMASADPSPPMGGTSTRR